MDPDLAKALNDAWTRIAPRLAANPDELARRLTRRRHPILQNPPRPWCLAVRAADTRIASWQFPMVPDHPITQDPAGRLHYHPHQVTLETRTLSWLCRPVAIPSPGLDAADAAKLLGVNRAAIMQAVRRGHFSVHYVKGLGGKRQHIPIVSSPRLLDPAGFPIGRMSDIEWGAHWRYLSDCLPADLSQTLTRVPLFRPFNPFARRRTPRLPPPQDYVWYKWKDGVFHDPHLLRHPPRPRQPQAPTSPPATGHSQPATDNSPPPTSTVFRGWRWLCPACQRLVTRLYYPLPALFQARFLESSTLARYSGRGHGEGLCPQIKNRKSKIENPRPDSSDSPDSIPTPLPTFACEKCHHIESYGFTDSSGWNHLVAHLSAGLLFGHEVAKPAWLTRRRKRTFRPRASSIPKTQQRIEPLLLHTTLDYRHIAARLQLPLGTVQFSIARIYARHHVHTRQALRAALSPCPQQSQSAG